MPHDAHIFNACGEMISRGQYSFMLKLVLQPVGNQSSYSRQLVSDFLLKNVPKY